MGDGVAVARTVNVGEGGEDGVTDGVGVCVGVCVGARVLVLVDDAVGVAVSVDSTPAATPAAPSPALVDAGDVPVGVSVGVGDEEATEMTCAVTVAGWAVSPCPLRPVLFQITQTNPTAADRKTRLVSTLATRPRPGWAGTGETISVPSGAGGRRSFRGVAARAPEDGVFCPALGVGGLGVGVLCWMGVFGVWGVGVGFGGGGAGRWRGRSERFMAN